MRDLLPILILAAIVLALAVSALGCTVLPTGETTSLVVVGLEVGESGVWTDGTSVVARGAEARARIWSKAPTLWTVPVEWVEAIERDLLAGETVCIRFYPQEMVTLTGETPPPVWARYAPGLEVQP